MQVVYLDYNLTRQELLDPGNINEDTRSFSRHGLHHILKLHHLSRDLLGALDNLLSCKTISHYVYPDFDQTGCVIISGSESDLNFLTRALESSGGCCTKLGLLINKALDGAINNANNSLLLGGRYYNLDEKTLVMGILNVTPDSFSDGGRFNNFDKALAQAYQMAEDGADIIDIGGESTRPGYEKAERVSAAEEINRVLPLINTLKKDNAFRLPISIDTYKAETAEQALAAGADLLNDVWGFKEDQNIATVAAKYNVPVCLMHNRRSTLYNDLIADIIQELQVSVDLADRAGVETNNIILDPGIGFGKEHHQNLDVMLHLREIKALGFPLLLGTSRKRIVGNTLNLPVDDRVEGTAATIAYGISAGVDIVRVHDVKEMRRVVDMTDALVRR